MHIRTRRVVAAALAATVAASTVAATSTTSASSHRAIPNGEWAGIITFFGDTGTARGDFEGSFRLQAASGAASGDFDWQGIVDTDAVGDVAVTIVGEVTGDTTSPLFNLTGGTSGGTPIPDATGSGNIVLTNVTCESIEGTGENITTAAQISDIEWFAIRASEPLAAGTFFDDLRALRVDAINLVGDLGTRPVLDLITEINRLGGEAIVLLAQVDRTPECQAFHFRSLIASQVQLLLEAVIEDPRLANAAEFADLVLLALQAGAWGPGAADADALDFEVAITEEFLRRVDEAIAAGDEVALLQLAWLAHSVGFDDVVDRIFAAGGGS